MKKVTHFLNGKYLQMQRNMHLDWKYKEKYFAHRYQLSHCKIIVYIPPECFFLIRIL